MSLSSILHLQATSVALVVPLTQDVQTNGPHRLPGSLSHPRPYHADLLFQQTLDPTAHSTPSMLPTDWFDDPEHCRR